MCGVRRDEVFFFLPRSFFFFRVREIEGRGGRRRCRTGGGARIIHLIRRVRACDLLRRCAVQYCLDLFGAFSSFAQCVGVIVEQNLS